MRKFVVVIIAFFVALVILSFNFQLNKVVGTSMEPTMTSGKHFIVRKYFLSTPDPRRSEIVIYKIPGVENDFIGRVIALPKESLRIENGNIYIDDNVKKYRLEEEYVSAPGSTKSYTDGKWVKLGEYDYLILGDHRASTIDIQSYVIKRSDIKAALQISF